MKKGLVVTTVVAAMLAVGCKPSGGGGKKDEGSWSNFFENAMNEAFGEVLPFLDLNEESIYFSFESDDGSGEFVIGDDNETNLLEGYGKKLKKLGFEEKEDSGDIYYQKIENNFSVTASFKYYEATEYYEAGNEIDVEYGFTSDEAKAASSAESLEFESVEAFFSDFFDVEGLSIPAYEGTAVRKGLYFDPDKGELEYDIYGSSAAEMDAFALALADAGWTVGDGYYSGDYTAYFEDTGAFVDVENWIGYTGDCIKVQFYFVEPPSSDFPIQRVLDFLSMDGVGEDNFAPYESEEALFKYDDSMASSRGGCDVIITNSTAAECLAYVQSMANDFGWTQGETQYQYDSEDASLLVATIYPLTLVTGGSHDVAMYVYECVSYNGNIDLLIGSTVHMEEETSTTFPLEQLNAFLEEYELGFSLTAGLPGESFTYSTFENDGYHCFQVKVAGDAVATMKEALNDILVGAGYSLSSNSTTSYVQYDNDAEHQIQIAISGDETIVNFWE